MIDHHRFSESYYTLLIIFFHLSVSICQHLSASVYLSASVMIILRSCRQCKELSKQVEAMTMKCGKLLLSRNFDKRKGGVSVGRGLAKKRSLHETSTEKLKREQEMEEISKLIAIELKDILAEAIKPSFCNKCCNCAPSSAGGAGCPNCSKGLFECRCQCFCECVCVERAKPSVPCPTSDSNHDTSSSEEEEEEKHEKKTVSPGAKERKPNSEESDSESDHPPKPKRKDELSSINEFLAVHNVFSDYI
jgi:hypothetical protein